MMANTIVRDSTGRVFSDLEDAVLDVFADDLIELSRDIDLELILQNPVDTGASAAHWFWSTDNQDPDGSYTFDPGQTSRPLNKSTQAIRKSQIKQGKNVYLHNPAPYIDLLNNGSSSQAPAKFIENIIDSKILQYYG